MPAADAPTRPRGTMGSGTSLSGWGAALDVLEHVPDLTWPTSVQTYGRMRHDPTLSSVLAAYRLPILKARWEIDPRGASPAIVQACADSLGLPVRGRPSEPGPARRRGVQWLTHLRAALGILTFGHAVFEPVYDVTSGTAMLASLGERLPLSIAEIDIDDQGELKGIKQYGDATRTMPGLIPADRLLWYARDREGATWTGSSMLRPAFGAWLLKQDALRVGATSLRRFGAGTPSVEWEPGSQPTADQMAAANRAASAVRVGDSGGAAMPPGARLRVRGVEGTYPDALPFVRYLDEQMSRAALASMLDLGNTANGSRALGATFADLLAMAQQGVAEQVAETATQLCVRLTDYNEGDTASAPAVVVGEVGASRQVMAQSIADLVRAGAIERDDDLEDWVRDAFDAPARRAPSKPAPEPPATDPAPAPVAASRRVKALRQAPNDAFEPEAKQTRELTADEQAAGLDPEAVDAAHGEVLAALLAAWLLVQADQRDQLTTGIAEALATGGVAALPGVGVSAVDAAEVIAAGMLEAADHGARLATAEAAAQGVTVPTPVVDTATVEATATALAGALTATVTATAVRHAVSLTGPDADPERVAADVAAHLDGLSAEWVTAQMSGAVQAGMGAGRDAVYQAAPPARYVASEILDGATCRSSDSSDGVRCWEVDGTSYDTLTAAREDYPSGRYRRCKGDVRCRGMILAIYEDAP